MFQRSKNPVKFSHRVLSVGSCSSDDARLARVIAAETGAGMDAAFTRAEALEMIEKGEYALVLVNRVIDGDGSSGADFIAAAREAGGAGVPLMLVSDYADAQAQAVANGALPGFGKSTLFEAGTAEMLKQVVTRASHPQS